MSKEKFMGWWKFLVIISIIIMNGNVLSTFPGKLSTLKVYFNNSNILMFLEAIS
jgi:hypothetical protein